MNIISAFHNTFLQNFKKNLLAQKKNNCISFFFPTLYLGKKAELST